ncbi:MAG TPA: zinc ribbon domain-containing protein [Steroidobacteraceae bacterium]|jgi:putative FmdB family regulatory protein|nr:zinc ribbon domain-containing protein [Steroidobacteraceae bacterium]HJY38115.1 zinc ribbon domain-containing protein [Steroidobacteraceae bacterium]
MPIYEYECSNCKFYVEALQKISEAPLKQCPSCKKQTLKRLVSAPVFRLKGGGWYETDFKSDQEGQRNLAKGEEPEAEAKPADDKADKADKAEKPAQTKKEADNKPGAASKKPAVRKVSRPAAKSKSKPKAKSKAKSKAAKRRR